MSQTLSPPAPLQKEDAMFTPNHGTPIEILLVEDNPDDAFITMEALRDGKVRNTVHHVQDGVEALRFLRRQNKYANAPRPDLILLDISLPRMSGLEVLAEIKQD